jgi:hypothetical protein
MKFVHPEILWALTALSIPILVHLFNFRKFKKVLFPNVEFLREIQQETKSKSKLKHLLILLSRLLALTAVIFAFAQPFIPQPGLTSKPGGTAVSVYIDNSFSMEARGSDGQILEIAKNKAIEIVNSFQPSDKFQLLTSDFEGRHQRLVSREDMIQLIQEVDVSPVSRKMSEVVARQKDVLFRSGLENRKSFILTDLQQSVTDIGSIDNDTTVSFNIVPEVAGVLSNLYIDSVWFESPVRQLNQPEILHVQVVNSGDETRTNIPLQLTVNGQQKSVTTVSVDGNQKAEVEVTYTNTEPGFKSCMVHVDDNGISKDDDYYFSYRVADKITVLEILGSQAEVPAVATVFSDDPYFVFTSFSESSVNYGSFTTQNLIVLNQLKNLSSGLLGELQKFVSNGGSMLIIPAKDIVLNEYNAALAGFGLGQILGKNPNASKVTMVNYDHYIFRDAFDKVTGNADLPNALAYYELQPGTKTLAEPMMTLQSGTPFMLSAASGKGRIYLMAVSLSTSESNFINHAFFPATMLRIAEFSQPGAELAFTLGRQQAVLLRNLNTTGDQTFRLNHVQLGSEFIPEHRNAAGNTEIFVDRELQLAGNYMLNFGTEPQAALAFNYDRNESDNRALSADLVAEQLEESGFFNWTLLNGDMESIAAGAGELNDGKRMWLTMIVWALIFLAVEVLLIKFWR